MSSIYDALKRVQEDGRATEYSSAPQPSVKGVKFWLIVIGAIILSSATTVILYGRFSDDKETALPAQTAAQPPKMATHVQTRAVPPDPEILFARAEAARRAGNTADSAALYQKALGLAPGRNRDAYVRLGGLYFERQQYDRAAATYQTALTYFKDDAVILNNLGGVLLAKGDTAGAIGYFRLASNCSKDYVEPVYNLACAYARKGDKTAALNALNKALGMHPDVRRWAEKDPDLEILKGAAPVKESEKGE